MEEGNIADEDKFSVERSKETSQSGEIATKESAGDGEGRMSKRQLKKLQKRERYEKVKIARRQHTRARQKEITKEKKESGEFISRKRLKENSMETSSCQVGIAIDMSFDDLMINKDQCKCVKQIHRCYSLNRRQPDPVQFYVTSFSGASRDVMSKHDGWKNWDVHFTEDSYMQLGKYPKENLVYLSSESENALEKVENGKLYIIGGLVDHNSKKGLCHSIAIKNGIQHCRLPIDEFLSIKTRKVLTIDHVFEILLLVSKGQSWKDALVKVMPERKGALIRSGQASLQTDKKCKEEPCESRPVEEKR